MTNKKTYLYLARRDKKGIKILMVFPRGKDDFPPTRLRDVKTLGLSPSLTEELTKIIYNDRMMWEPFLECAESFDDLTKLLTKRGYGMIPMHCSPLLERSSDLNDLPTLSQKKKTMLRKQN